MAASTLVVLAAGSAAAAAAGSPAPQDPGIPRSSAATAEKLSSTAGPGPAASPSRQPAPPRTAAQSPSLAAPAATDDSKGGDDASVEELIRYWTPERIAAATDLSGRPAPSQPQAPRRVKRDDGSAKHFTGLKSVGVLFGDGKDMKHHYCTASVVKSADRDLILTAGHCKFHDKVAFVPFYDPLKNASAQPYGMWPVNAKNWFIYDEYEKNTKKDTSDLDFAFARVNAVKGKKVQDVVGGNTLARTKSFTNKVTIIGHPTISHNKPDTPVQCRTTTEPLGGFNQMKTDCAGMWGGVSGGPWFSNLNNDGTGEIIGNTGGYNSGGIDDSDSPMYDRITYSPMHQDHFFRLYDDAQKGRRVAYGAYQQPKLPFSLGGGGTWKHAKLMSAGDFTGRGRSDLVVVWTDGEVTLYSSDGRGGFDGERRLRKANGTWTHAEGITAGDFTGGSQFDLLVRWSDGEVTVFGDIGTKGLDNDGAQMTKPGARWKHATQITADRFNAQKYVTDLMARWSDGELTLYTNVSAGTFGQEHKLKDPNKAWEDATLLTAGEYSGTGKWDLLVRWKDGSINTTTSSLCATHTVSGGKWSTWTHSTVMATGNFTGNGRTDDLVIRWSDGETTLYQDATTERLGTERNLVPAA
ncbi:hypothetical protein ABZ769_27035 [Streptomyces olivoreticuli]